MPSIRKEIVGTNQAPWDLGSLQTMPGRHGRANVEPRGKATEVYMVNHPNLSLWSLDGGQVVLALRSARLE